MTLQLNCALAYPKDEFYDAALTDTECLTSSSDAPDTGQVKPYTDLEDSQSRYSYTALSVLQWNSSGFVVD